MALPPGAVIGGYRIVRVLGSGGMGSVYLGQHPSLPRQDAIKVLSEELSLDPEFRARFEREANLTAGLDHANIVSVYNRGEEDSRLWIAMQYVPGADAADEARQGPAFMPPQRAMHIIAEVGKGLDYAHRRGLLHRDIKPANFLLSRSAEDEQERVLLTDFGVAKSVNDSQDLTATGKFMATVAYASPEQLLGQPLDHRSDIYSLGCSFYRLLTGQNPFPSTVPAVVMMGHLNEAPPPISSVRPDLPSTLDHVFAKVLAKDPADRYNTCGEFVNEAQAALFGQPLYPPRAGGNTTPHSGYSTTGGPYTSGFPSVPSFPGNQGSIVTQPRDSYPDHNLRPPAVERRRRIFVFAAVTIVAVLAAVGAVFAVSRGNPRDAGGADLAKVRSEHPEFAGKTVAAFNYGNSIFSVALDGSPQANFLRDIGFRYSDEYLPLKNEKSPRDLSLAAFDLPQPLDLIIVSRSDNSAGNGGLGGLPNEFLTSSAKIVVIDDINAVQGFQVWTDQSPAAMVDKLVPAIANVVD
ncbi:serine/threonine-protein kinase [Nocardia carnea]|uniref:serine/threonine-protein kinase n=1 Tax=Nocardia carnea TaxID=37328 RepID=UPI002456FF66|nr:serine/threonine-protein kinase [Nocardia carnea]